MSYTLKEGLMKIYKHTLNSIGIPITFQMFAPAKVLSVKEQFGKIAIYALEDTTKETVKQVFIAIPTGQNIEDFIYGELEDWVFIDTVKLSGGALMWHILRFSPLKEDS